MAMIHVYWFGVFLISRSLSDGLHLEFGVVHMEQARIASTIVDTQFNCTLPMFDEDENAYIACLAENALQRNWYPSPIGGLFSYQAWNGFDGFWQNGIILETMLNFMHYAKHNRYQSVVTGALRDVDSLLEAYYPQPSYDDMSWYGLSYARTFEVLGKEAFLDTARKIYDWNWQNGWDNTTCSGGMWFDQSNSFKATITNVQMFQLGAKLYILSGSSDKGLLRQTNTTMQWIMKTGILDPANYSVYDSVDLTTCKARTSIPWTYNCGVLIGGLVLWANITADQAYMTLAHKVANSTITNLSVDGILTEQCDNTSCGADNIVFKGIFVRNLRYLADVSPYPEREFYMRWLQRNAKLMVQNDSCWNDCDINYQDGAPYFNATTPVFDTNWHGPFNWTSPKQQVSALDLLVSAIKEDTKCSGVGCTYDPPTPPVTPVSCKNDPCPPGQPCCEYEGGYRTCCESTQKCVDGYCD